MKKSILATVMAAMPAMMFAQSAVDLYQASQSELRGTARFMSMAGAFGALGGDMSTMRQNPAGIGIYRRSEIGATLDIDIQNSKFTSQGLSSTNSQTKVACDNVGYIGSTRTDSEVMPFFSWGISYGRAMSFDRVYHGSVPSLSNSLSNYISNNVANGWTSFELSGEALDANGYPYDPAQLYNPYYEGDAPWLGILGYQAYMANPTFDGSTKYNGLYKNGVSGGDATINARERGYIDEYNFSFGGNFVNTVYWGLSFGITDMNYTLESYYDESITKAQIVTETSPFDPVQGGGAYTGLSNYFNVSGTGFNCKLGLILKPINEFRIGFAVHTPTWYNLTYNIGAAADYAYWEGNAEQPFRTNMPGYDVTPDKNEYLKVSGYYDRKMRTPWRMIVSAAGVIGGRGILSMDYEYEAYKDMRVSDQYGTFDDVTMDVKNYYRATSTIRVGAEFRVSPQLSLRAGYSYKSSPAQETAYNGGQYIYTAGTNPMYMFDSSVQYVTCGLGYNINGFSIDAAYVHKHRESAWSAFTPCDGLLSPSGKITDNNNHIVLSVGYKF